MTRDHQEVDLGLLAGVTDRGLRHHRNEDAMELAVAQAQGGPVIVAVVCDGVSTSTRPDEASLAAAQAAAQVLTTAAESGEDLVEASTRAVQSAGKAVAQLVQPGASVPSATFVSAVLTSQTATLCWLGDSRAYWLAAAQDSDAEQLTTDDSLAQEMVNAGLLHQSEALTSPHAHVVTRWVGADPAEAPPHVATFGPPGPGVLLLCSDGLWNYQPEAAELASLALPRALTDPLGAAKELAQFAIESGGRDNITVVLVPFPPATDTPATDTPATDTPASGTIGSASRAGSAGWPAYPARISAWMPSVTSHTLTFMPATTQPSCSQNAMNSARSRSPRYTTWS
jgi:serine/threonine protein phosphatase PrpC